MSWCVPWVRQIRERRPAGREDRTGMYALWFFGRPDAETGITCGAGYVRAIGQLPDDDAPRSVSACRGAGGFYDPWRRPARGWPFGGRLRVGGVGCERVWSLVEDVRYGPMRRTGAATARAGAVQLELRARALSAPAGRL